ncbi:conjugal transfer pilus assembly protein TraK [Sphingobium sp. AP50]|uniref:type-F conjugative transfer system secretin TraK n=1 Tax=Sphingobium sp. AP50 TaxID=1884369 RepID=UPI0008C8715A|nr:type-F conjugative transfer system secretin TraK [Sphingobium sp. AP50]SEK04069.1 conjugal transfer pilus assembly protein TraK [Sphingobium sp. AP50]
MMPLYAIASAATGAAFLSRKCVGARTIGAALLFVSAALTTPHARADQNIVAADSAQVDCEVSGRDLTRISLVEDQFASVSKISNGNSSDDFSVVNEPVRGDIYLSVPDGFKRPMLSFFGTSKRGYVYKFACRILGDHAVQVFVSNPAIAREKATEGAAGEPAPDPQEAAVQLMQAMYAGDATPGYDMVQRSLRPIQVGDLKVQMIAEYRGSNLSGKVLRIENKGRSPIELNEKTVAPASALAVSIAEPSLAPGKVTTAYLVSLNGRQ